MKNFNKIAMAACSLLVATLFTSCIDGPVQKKTYSVKYEMIYSTSAPVDSAVATIFADGVLLHHVQLDANTTMVTYVKDSLKYGQVMDGSLKVALPNADADDSLQIYINVYAATKGKEYEEVGWAKKRTNFLVNDEYTLSCQYTVGKK